jgi:hypothetical protein
MSSLLVGLKFEFHARQMEDAGVVPGADAKINLGLQKDAIHAKIANGIHAVDLNAAMEPNVDPHKHQSQLLQITPTTSIGENLLAIGNTPVHGSSKHPEQEFWVVKNARHFTEHYGWVAVECSSPVMSPATVANDTKRVLQAIQASTEATTRLTHKFGLHLHVSQSEGSLSLKFAKRVATIVFAIEDDILWELVRPNMRYENGSLGTTSNFNRGFKRSSTGLSDGFELLPNVLLDVSERQMRNLWGATSLEELEWQLQAVAVFETKNALSLSRHEHPDGTMTWTIEFRHAQSSLDASFVKSWTSVVVGICKVAMLPDDLYSEKLTFMCNIVRSPRILTPTKIGLVLSKLGQGFTSKEGIDVPCFDDWKERLSLQKEGVDPDIADSS